MNGLRATSWTLTSFLVSIATITAAPTEGLVERARGRLSGVGGNPVRTAHELDEAQWANGVSVVQAVGPGFHRSRKLTLVR